MTQAEYACLTSPVWWLVARSWCDNAEDEGPGRVIPSMKRNVGPLPAILDSVIEIMVSSYTPTGLVSSLGKIMRHSFIIEKIRLDIEVLEHQRLTTNKKDYLSHATLTPNASI